MDISRLRHTKSLIKVVLSYEVTGFHITAPCHYVHISLPKVILNSSQLLLEILNLFFVDFYALCVNLSIFFYHLNLFISCYCLDYLLHDITPEEEAEHVGFIPRNNVHFSILSDKECSQNTGFNKFKLEQIFKCFGL